MSQNPIEPQYALMNNCDPCGKKSQSAMAGLAGSVARVVSPRPDVNNYTARINNVLVHVNALNAGSSEMAHPKAYMTGYTAGVARY